MPRSMPFSGHKQNFSQLYTLIICDLLNSIGLWAVVHFTRADINRPALLPTSDDRITETNLAKDPSSGKAAGPRQPKARRKGVTIDLDAEEVGKAGTKNDPAGGAAKKPARSVSSKPSSLEATRPRAVKGKPAGGKAKAAASARGPADRKPGDPEPDRPTQSAVPQNASESQQPSGASGQSSSSPLLAASGLVAAFAGGIIALGGAVVLDRLHIVSIFSAGPGLSDLQTEITSVQETTGGQIADLQARIAMLPATRGADADGRTALGEKIAQIEASLADLGKGVTALDRQETLSDLEPRLAALETAVQSGAAGPGAGLAAIEQKLADVEEAVAAVRDRADEAASDAVAATKPEIDRLAAIADELAGRVKALEGGASGLVDSQTVAALGARLEKLAGVIDKSASLQTIAALKSALAAESLAAAVAAGRPFAAELQILQSRPDGGADLTVIAPYAENGLPDAATLAAEFKALIPSLLPLEPERPAAPQSSGLVGRLLASARNVVEVRQVGPGAGGEATGQGGAVLQALNGNNLKAARTAWLDLPPQSRQASADWAAKLEARLAADALAGLLRSKALSRLATAGGGASQ